MRNTPRAFAVLLAASITLAGCGSNSLDTTGDKKGGEVKTSVDKAAAALVPKAIQDKGTLNVGTDATYAPSEFLAGDGKTVQGFDVDLFKAVLGKLGLKATFIPSKFDSIITGVQGGKYDVGMSSFSINPDRLKQANMVSYYVAGTQWATLPGNPKHIDPQHPCGITIAVQKASTQQEDDIPGKIAACNKAGKKTRDPLIYDGQDQVTAAVASGKADAMLSDSPVVAYAVKQSKGKIEPLGDVYDSASYGYVIPKDDKAFADAIAAALKSLAADGTYLKILKSWAVEHGAIKDFVVNPPA